MRQVKSLNIILPVYNEAESIEKVIKDWHLELKNYKLQHRFIICEDGSTDGTQEVLIKMKKKYPLLLNQKSQRRGYGRAVIDGIVSSKSEYILCIDSDGQCDPGDFGKFWKNKDRADVLIGWRKKRADSLQRLVFSFMFKLFFKFLFAEKIHDPSAPYVLFKKDILTKNRLHQLAFLNEGFWWGFIAMSNKNKLKIIELPINHKNRIMGDTQVYKAKKVPGIAFRNALGLIRLRFA